MVFQDESGLLDLPLPNLPGAHQMRTPAPRWRRCAHSAWRSGHATPRSRAPNGPRACSASTAAPLAEPPRAAELWLDGGHNAAAGQALARHLASLPERPTHLICGMLNTKDIGGYLRPLAAQARA